MCHLRAAGGGRKSAGALHQEAVEWLEGEDFHGTYSVGCGRRCWNLLPTAARTKAVIDGRDATRISVLGAADSKGLEKAFTGILMGRRAPCRLAR